MQKSNIFIISGPSGAGEDSIINELEKQLPIERIITTTTRNKRVGESEGKSYYFISKEEFEKRLLRGDFAEYAQHYNGNFYGVTKLELKRVQESSKIGIWKIEYKGVMSIKKIHPEIASIFISTPNLKMLEDRIRNRDNVTEEYIEERMKYTKEWLKHIDIYDHIVVNDNGKLKEAVGNVVDIIEKK